MTEAAASKPSYKHLYAIETRDERGQVVYIVTQPIARIERGEPRMGADGAWSDLARRFSAKFVRGETTASEAADDQPLEATGTHLGDTPHRALGLVDPLHSGGGSRLSINGVSHA